DDTLRKFPVNSRAHVQRQWMERLGLSEAETQEKLNHYRQRNEQGGDIRWCSIHFNSPIGLPIDLRQNPAPALQSRELRLDLQMDRLNDRYRNPTVASTPDVSDNDMDEAGLETPPRLSPSRPSTSRPIGADLEYHDDELYTGMAKRFKTMSSIRTNTTIDKGSEYVPSEESGGDTEESDSEETSENGKRERKYRIVGNEQLLELFRRCKECGAQLDTSEVVMREEGSACIVDYACLSCGKSVTWRSQSRGIWEYEDEFSEQY
ncbi:hypothetical protein PENTCL1PPCAC_21439, partial [Pristionchus entomophagus]